MIAACYSMDLYCENHAADPERHGYNYTPTTFTGETWGECAKQARIEGWRISRDSRQCWCARCAAEKNRNKRRSEAEMKLTHAQEAMLRRVVASNGGGVHAGWHEGQRETRVLRKLEALGLVQGKASVPSWAVHTREGLEWVRAHPQP